MKFVLFLIFHITKNTLCKQNFCVAGACKLPALLQRGWAFLHKTGLSAVLLAKCDSILELQHCISQAYLYGNGMHCGNFCLYRMQVYCVHMFVHCLLVIAPRYLVHAELQQYNSHFVCSSMQGHKHMLPDCNPMQHIPCTWHDTGLYLW